jgi:hypothetical protein
VRDRAARPAEQLGPQVTLKLRDLTADRCERRLQVARCGGQAAGLYHGDEGRHRFQAIHRILFHNPEG